VLVDDPATQLILKAEDVHRINFDFGELEVAVDHDASAVHGSVGSDGQLDMFDRRHDPDSIFLISMCAKFGAVPATSTLAVAFVVHVSL
jgi:hypothetical protein